MAVERVTDKSSVLTGGLYQDDGTRQDDENVILTGGLFTGGSSSPTEVDGLDEIMSFGGRNIAFRLGTNCISGVYDGSTSFCSCSDKIFIGGMPLTLSQNISGLGYSINIIIGSSIQNYSDREILAVWEGDLVSILQMEESRRYWNLYLINNTKSLTAGINFSGMPLIRNENYRLVFINSGYSLSNVEEFAEVSIGGIPVSVGRISERWYLIVNNAA